MTTAFKPYPKYKPSGVEWLGDIPEHWTKEPLRNCINYQEGPGIMAVDFLDEGIPLLRIAGVQSEWATLEGCNYLNPEKVKKRWNHFRLEEGDLLISGSATMGTVTEVHSETVGAIPYTGLIRLRGEDSKIIKPFIKHIVISSVFMTQIDLLKAGATIQHFGPTHLGQMFVVLPQIKEQSAIATFLDSETAKIDETIKELEASIELLNEEKITKFVNILHNLQPRKKLKFIGRFKGGAGFPIGEQEDSEGDVPFFKVKHLSQASPDGYLSNSEFKITSPTAAKLGATIFPQGTIVFAKVGAALLLNRFAVIKLPACIDNNMMGLEINNPSAHKPYVLKAMQTLIKFEELVNPGAIPSINTDPIATQTIPFPPTNIQKQAAERMSQVEAHCAALISEKQSLIETLKEYRTSLIHEAVTGKIDLRDV